MAGGCGVLQPGREMRAAAGDGLRHRSAATHLVTVGTVVEGSGDIAGHGSGAGCCSQRGHAATSAVLLAQRCPVCSPRRWPCLRVVSTPADLHRAACAGGCLHRGFGAGICLQEKSSPWARAAMGSPMHGQAACSPRCGAVPCREDGCQGHGCPAKHLGLPSPGPCSAPAPAWSNPIAASHVTSKGTCTRSRGQFHLGRGWSKPR